MPQMLSLTKLIKCDAFRVLHNRVSPALLGLAELFFGKENISTTNLDEIQCVGECEALADVANKRQVSVPVCSL